MHCFRSPTQTERPASACRRTKKASWIGLVSWNSSTTTSWSRRDRSAWTRWVVDEVEGAVDHVDVVDDTALSLPLLIRHEPRARGVEDRVRGVAKLLMQPRVLAIAASREADAMDVDLGLLRRCHRGKLRPARPAELAVGEELLSSP